MSGEPFVNRDADQSLWQKEKDSTLNALLHMVREKRAIEILLQVRAKIQDMNLLIDLIENNPCVFHQLLDQLESKRKKR
jgi:hypothetical protein